MPSQVSTCVLFHLGKYRFLMISGGILIFHGLNVPVQCPVFQSQCPSVQSSQCLSVPMSKCPNVTMSHCPSGATFHKSRHPPVSGPGPSEIQISKIKSYPIESFSILTLLIFNVDSNCIFRRFKFRVYIWAKVTLLL